MANTFVKIRALERAKQLLEENSYVIIKGNPGSGKTTLAKWLLKILMDNGKRPLQLFKVSKLYGRVSADDNVALFIDNVFGEFSFSTTEFNEFINKKELITSVLKYNENRTGNVLLLTIRNDIYMEVLDKRKSNSFFCSSVTDLSSGEYALQTNEIEMFLEKYGLSAEGKGQDMKEKHSELYRSLGFPQCCSLARGNPEFGKNISNFLNDPSLYLKDYIDTQIREKHAKTAVLIYILLKGGHVEAALFKNQKDRETKMVALGMLELGRPSFGQFQKSIHLYEGFLTKHDKINNAFMFSHSSVQEAIFRELFVAFPEEITRNCHHSLLQSLTTSINPKSTQIVIEKEMFEIVACRIEQILREGSDSGFRSISVLELWTDSDFYHHILKNELCIEYIKKQVDSKGNGMIVHFAKAGHIDWIRELLQNSDETQKYRSLNAACAENQESIVRNILSSGVKSDLTTCFHAIQGGNLNLFMELCESVDALQTSFSLHPKCSNTNNSLLQEACSMEQLQFVEPLLSRYPKLKDIKNKFGETAMHSAAQSGNINVFNLLLKAGLNPLERNYKMETVLACAVKHGKLSMVKFLVKKYPRLLQSHTFYHGTTILHLAALSGNVDLFEFLTGQYELPSTRLKKPNISKRDDDGLNVLHYACSAGHLEISRFLISKYPQLLSEKDNYGEDVLHKAAVGGNVDLFQLLLNEGLKIESTANNGNSVLHSSLYTDKEEVCRFLVNNYPDFIKKRNNAGWTAVHCACEGGNVGHLSFLYDKGLDIDALTNLGKCVLHIACYSANYDVSRYLAEKYKKFLHIIDKRGHTVLHDASFGGNVDIFKLLITKGLDINCVEHNGKTVLHICCYKARKGMCEYLVENYPHLLDIKDNNGHTVLHDACIGGRVDIVDFLVTKGMNIKAVTNIEDLNENTYPRNSEMSQFLKKGNNINATGGKTVLHISCLCSRRQMCVYLVQCYPQLMEIKDNAGRTVLHDACLGGNVGILSFLLSKGMDINALTTLGNSVLNMSCISAKYIVCEYLVNYFPHLLNVINKDGYSCLHLSAAGGNVDILKLFLRKGMDINSVGKSGKTVLGISCRFAQSEMCYFLSENYAHLKEIKDNEGQTALHDACWGGDVNIFTFLLGEGLDINALTDKGETLLHFACESGKYSLCECLIFNHSHLLNQKDDFGYTVLHLAATSGNIDVVKLLREKGLDMMSVGLNGKTVLHLSSMNSRKEMCKYILQYYPQLKNIRDEDGHTALHDACEGGNVDTVSFLLARGFDINALTNTGETVLHSACFNGNYSVCMFLLDKHPHLLNVKDRHGNSVLHDAASGGNVNILKCLITKGLKLNSLGANRKTVLHFACHYCRKEMCEYLINNFSQLMYIKDTEGYTALHEACIGGDVSILSILLDKGMNINALDRRGYSVLDVACSNGKYAVCKYLVAKHKDLLRFRHKYGFSLLHSTALGGNVEIFKFLRIKGVEINSDVNGKTVLHICCLQGKQEMCKFLLENYSHLKNVKDRFGHTALHDACIGGNLEMVRYLLGKGLNVNILTNAGESVLNLAYDNKKHDIFQYFVNSHPHLVLCLFKDYEM
ncbi:serine/threonine-protein phosphatase 6 regulatory ankyrin repeat subunit B-like [Saccostrea echinata]|uniref:serine/threonine-protein phosphatase 6 regulatory ankyrin repeat subunit B-like n=1 Tax=Saccostrea echinata TaxID=191078 RepID=UPI002A8405B8|nr:serine/threonine-protein phosphatase 6 regulatory ankyrin repeat subunit B-like [Saccostrea echinata]